QKSLGSQGEQQDEQSKRDDGGVLSTKDKAREALHEPEQDPSDNRAHDAAESPEDTDGERGSQVAIRLKRGNWKHQAEQAPGRPGERGAQRECGDVGMLDSYTHEGGGITVHADRNDGAAEP